MHGAYSAGEVPLESEMSRSEGMETTLQQPTGPTPKMPPRRILPKVAPKGPSPGIALKVKEPNSSVPQDEQLEDAETGGQPASFVADILQQVRDNVARGQPEAPAMAKKDAAVASLMQQVQGNVERALPDERPKKDASSVASLMQQVQDNVARGMPETERPKKDTSSVASLMQ